MWGAASVPESLSVRSVLSVVVGHSSFSSACLLLAVPDGGHHGLGYVCGGFGAAAREAGPVVEVDDAQGAVGVLDTLPAVDHQVEFLCGRTADGLQPLVGDVVLIFAGLHILGLEGLEPVKEGGSGHSIEFYELARQMARDHGAFESPQEIFLEDILGLGGRPYVAHILGVLGVEVAALDPALLHPELYEPGLYHLVGVHDDAFRDGDVVAGEDARLALADAVLDAVARVDDKAPLLLHLLQQFGGAALATHVDNHRLAHFTAAKLLLAVDVDLTAAFAQLLGHGVHYRGVVSDVVWGEHSRAHYSCNLCCGHGSNQFPLTLQPAKVALFALISKKGAAASHARGECSQW